MVPTMRPSPKTSILAPTRCGVEPVVETIVTSAAASPRFERGRHGSKDFAIPLAIIRGGGAEGGGRDGLDGQDGQDGQEGRTGRKPS